MKSDNPVLDFAETVTPLVLKYRETMTPDECQKAINRLFKQGRITRLVVSGESMVRAVGGDKVVLPDGSMSRRKQNRLLAEAAMMLQISGVSFEDETKRLEARLAA